MTRVNGLFERDLSLTMELIEIINPPFSGTSTISLVEPDGFTDDDAGALLGQNQTITDTRIGTANYDVGHVFTTGGGGVAILGGICFSNTKARAVTGLPSPIGDPYDVDFVAHEMGHHFGANHIFNGSQGNCSGANRNASTSVEPGSGTSIMGYAGICAGDNIQPNSDDHFNAISIDEMYARITSSPTCSVNTMNNNIAPIADAGDDYTIPFGTAFTLSGTGNDNVGTVSYNWEQVDPGTVAGQPSPTDTNGPMFRSRPSLPNSDRTFPPLNAILNDHLTPEWEVMPSIARDMDFSLTVRDNQSPNGGQTNRDDMRVTLANTGPFRVTAPDITNASFPSGSATTITWDVAGTTANGINTSNVNILLSTDGGQTFSTTLASNTNNDGTESVTFPSVNEPFCRIKIEAVGNIYFAISKSFSIGATTTTVCNTYTTGSISIAIPDSGGQNVQGTPVFIPVTVTESAPIMDIRVNVDVTHSYIGDLLMQLQAPNGGGFTNIWSRNCNDAPFGNFNLTFKDEQSAIFCGSPTTGLVNPANPLNGFNGNDPSGQWNLVFVDFFNGDTGTVNEWSIDICSTTFVLSNDSFELNDFALFPNPNKGDFTLQFNSNSGKGINVGVYDISGKLVFNSNYNTTPRFDKQISLNNVSAGIYIMKVNDGDKTVTRKLIVE